jgi:hypothetical protein
MDENTKGGTKPFQIRMPEDLKAHIRRRLPRTKRTLTAEILYLAERGLHDVGDPMPDQADAQG